MPFRFAAHEAIASNIASCSPREEMWFHPKSRPTSPIRMGSCTSKSSITWFRCVCASDSPPSGASCMSSKARCCASRRRSRWLLAPPSSTVSATLPPVTHQGCMPNPIATLPKREKRSRASSHSAGVTAFANNSVPASSASAATSSPLSMKPRWQCISCIGVIINSIRTKSQYKQKELLHRKGFLSRLPRLQSPILKYPKEKTVGKGMSWLIPTSW